MQFNSLEYVIFLPVVFLLYWFVFKRHKWQNVFLLAASYLFYGWWDWRFLLLIAFTSVFSFACGILIENYKGNRKRQKAVNALNIAVNLAILGVFKYFNFFVGNLVELLARFGISLDAPTVKIILPVGISFYTFQALSYTIDIYKEKISASRNIITYATYIAFFPQLVAGPIERAGNLLPQFGNKRVFNYEQAVDGCRQLLWGFFKKIVIADNCAVAVDMVWNGYTTYSGINLVVEGLFLYSIQIYCDFSGYSDMAIGIALLLGFRFNINFNSPYKSASITEFWRRWHISLSSWLRDYLYISLGGNRKGKVRQHLNLFITMFLGGLWHGASWNFVIWGSMHGTALSLHKIWMRLTGQKVGTPHKSRLTQLLSILLTFHFACFCWIFFRNRELDSSLQMISQIATNFQPQVALQLFAGYWKVFALMALGYLLHFVPDRIESSCRNAFVKLPAACYVLALVMLVWIVVQVKSSEIQPFIYFQF